MDKKLSEVEIRKLKKKEWWSEHVKSRFKSNQSQWSKFKGTHFIFKNQLLITTSKFTEDWINETNRNRLDTIFELYKRGWNNREITNFLNIFGIKKRNTKTDYTIKDVFMCLKKLKLREKRYKQISYVLGEWILYEVEYRDSSL